MKWFKNKKTYAEIINLSTDQIISMANQQCIQIESQAIVSKTIIGMKYEVDMVLKDGSMTLKGWNHGRFISVNPSQVIIHKI